MTNKKMLEKTLLMIRFKEMRVSLIVILIIFLVQSQELFCQNLVPFSKDLKLSSGIYTKVGQLYVNSPKYSNYSIELTDYFHFNIYYDREGNKVALDEKPLIYVEDKFIWIDYERRLNKFIIKGTISTFFVEHITEDLYNKHQRSKVKFLYFDLKTGKVNKITPASIEDFLVRDKKLYDDYLSLKNSERKKLHYN